MRPFGKFLLVEPLASGGMADVWRARVAGPEGVVKEVALKLVRGEHAAKGDFVRMFVQEARLAARLTHANVVQVFEFDQVDGRYYLAMELVRGRHLGQVVERARERGVRLGLARAVHVGAELARGLAYAHRLSEDGRPLGLVHRDVSPHNVLVSFEGEVKLADFGIARAMNGEGLTEPGTLKGKLGYMAPEQARGAAVDARADVFSLGVILWELCAGRRLFARESEAATLGAVLSEEAISPPSSWNEEVPPELDAAILGALARDPERRTASAQVLAGALAGVLLRVARAPEEVDLRPFMHRLFEDEITRAAAAPAAEDGTLVRPVALAREPEVAPLGAAGDGDEEAATRTAAAPARRRRRAVVVPVAAGVAAVAAAALLAGRGPDPATAGTRERPASPARPARATPPPPVAERAAAGEPAPREVETAARASAAEAAAPASASPAALPGAPEAAVAAAAREGTAVRASLAAEPRRTGGAGPRRPVEAVNALGKLRVPPRESGEGILAVNATPWGTVAVDGFVLGETPQEARVAAGWHRVRIDRPNQPAVEVRVKVEPGARRLVLR